MKEEWREFRSSGYLVSSEGRVKSPNITIERKNNRPHTSKSVVLKLATDGRGYNRVAFKFNGKLSTFKVHRLVAEVFLGESKLEVNHKNGDKKDNRVINLEWVSHADNIRHAFLSGLMSPRVGSNNSSAKINEQMALIIKELLKTKGPAEISRELGLSLNIIKDISRKRTWLHV